MVSYPVDKQKFVCLANFALRLKKANFYQFMTAMTVLDPIGGPIA